MSTQPNPIVGGIPNPPNAFQIAQRMIEMGAYVYFIPQGTKRCTVNSWPELATRDLSVAKTLAGDKHLNVMVVGKRDGLWVLEFDDVSVLGEYEKICGRVETYRVRSVSGGTHLYFKQTEASWEMGNIGGKNDAGKETWSARIDNKYVLAPFSAAHPHNDETLPLTYYMTIEKLPVIEASATLIAFLKEKAGQNAKKAAVSLAAQPGVKIAHGGIHPYLLTEAGRLRHMNVPLDVLESTLIAVAHANCEAPIDEKKVSQIARSLGKYPAGTPVAQIVFAETNAPVNPTTDDEPEIEESLIASRPEFPRWVMAGTSLESGLVKPATERSSKYPELIFVPAMQMYVNALALHVHLKHKPRAVPNMYVGVIAPYGQYFKSTCCELAQQYFQCMGLAIKGGRDVKNADSKTIITSIGSTEGLGKAMAAINAKKCVLYFDELGKVAGKIGIENSSFGEDLLTMYESGDFGNTTKETKSNFNFEAKSYCFSWQWCTTDRAFPRHWAKLANISSGLNDRMFFLLAPEEPKEAGMFIDGDYQIGAVETLKLIQKAIQKGGFDYESSLYASSKFRGLDARGLAAAEWFALYFAVDLGLDVIDSECVDRARALADYRREVLVFLDPVEAETFQGKIQQEITRELRRHGGKMPYRELHHELHGERLGSGVWAAAFQGLVGNDTIAVREAKPGRGAAQRPKMVYLLKQEDYSEWKKAQEK